MESIWSKTCDMKKRQALDREIETEVAVIGGGMAGILTAYQLERSGVRTVVLEAERAGGGQTKNTTAKITSQHGMFCRDFIEKKGKDAARQYVRANQAAVEEYKRIIREEKIDCDLEETDSYVYSQDGERLKSEAGAALELGIEASYEHQVDIPAVCAGAVKFARQAQFHPLKFAAAIAKDLPILEHTRVKKFDKTTAFTEHGRIFAKKVIIASHFPFINTHGLYFMKQYQYRSYVLALGNAQDVGAMYISAFSDGLSLRNWGDTLLLGGRGHKTGKKSGGFAELWAFASSHYPGCSIRESWATQDCMTPDDIPYIGEYARSLPNFYVATGFNKWGMTSAMAAAQILADKIIGRENPNAAVFSPIGRKFKAQILVNAFQQIAGHQTDDQSECADQQVVPCAEIFHTAAASPGIHSH